MFPWVKIRNYETTKIKNIYNQLNHTISLGRKREEKKIEHTLWSLFLFEELKRNIRIGERDFLYEVE